jgi:hypothetical protein
VKNLEYWGRDEGKFGRRKEERRKGKEKRRLLVKE